jgi:hypothetical protein
MSPPTINSASAPEWLPDDLKPLFERVMQDLPAFPDRHKYAAVWREHVHEQSHRSLEAWPLPTRKLNGRACFEAREAVEYGFRRLLEAPKIRGGHRADVHEELTEVL